MRGSVFIAASLDGFIARPDGGIDWLTSGDAANDGAEGGAFGFQEFFQSVDALVMGRNSYELVRSFGVWPYEDKPVVVLTTRGVEIPPELASKVSQMQGEPAEVARRLAKERGYSHLYVDGGVTIQRFLRAGLIQRMTITRIPVLIGSGIPLFGPLDHDLRWRHVETHAFHNGFVQTTYEIAA